ncbi:ABC transporter permease [uncultured Desulfobacter sp.]|uniref:ABC transporter permease n=1 Tax=uncultured Desulfobacter sp. TaxID=240139 RepID=UPI002AAAABB7|nr:ABC transporter permease [uncultured Desulfobacter sp.]
MRLICIIGKIFEIAFIFFIILTVLFFLFRLSPGDPISRIVDPSLTAEDMTRMISQLGLDRSLWDQYILYLKHFFTGDFGVSFHYGLPVGKIIKERLGWTLLLFTSSTILAAFAGIYLGKIAAWKKGSFLDNMMSLSALVCYTLFIPWFALLMLWLFGFKLAICPLGGVLTPTLWAGASGLNMPRFFDLIQHMMLPLMTLFIINLGSYLLLMRSSMLTVLKEDYIITARAKGLSEKVIRDKHAAKNAALPVITSVGLSLAFSINGGALTEQIFSWPGIGRELIFAVSNNDYPLAQACFLLIALVVLVANMIVDLLYVWLDPRITY